MEVVPIDSKFAQYERTSFIKNYSNYKQNSVTMQLSLSQVSYLVYATSFLVVSISSTDQLDGKEYRVEPMKTFY